MISPFERVEYSKRVDDLLSNLSRRVYHYPKINKQSDQHEIIQETDNKQEEKNSDEAIGWLPVVEVVLTFQLYRPLSERNHGKSTKRSKMMYRSEGWKWNGSFILYEEDDPIIWLMSEERLTIDKILPLRKKGNSKKRTKSNKLSPFLNRNIRSTMKCYKDPLEGVFFAGTRESPWNPREEAKSAAAEKEKNSKKRPLPRKRGRPRKKRLVSM